MRRPSTVTRRQGRVISSSLLRTACALLILDLLEEVIAFVIHQNKRREVFHFDFPDGFHPQFRIGHALQALDALLRQHRRRTADAAEVKTAVFVTGIGDAGQRQPQPAGDRGLP